MSADGVPATEEAGNTRPLRILVVSQYFWPENFQINHLVRSLHARGHCVEVLTGKPNYPGGKFFENYTVFGRSYEVVDGVPVWRAPLISRGKGSGTRLALNYLSFAVASSLTALLRVRGPFDCVFVYAPSPITSCIPALAFGWWHRAPVVLWVQDLWPESVTAASQGGGTHFLLPALNVLVRSIYRGCSLILVQSQAFRPLIERFEIPPERIAYLPQSVDALFRPVEPDDDAPSALTEPGFRVVFAGNIGQAQDFETVVAAAERLRDEPVRWIIIGDGRRRPWLVDEVKRRGLERSVFLPGSFSEGRMPGFFAHADALLMTLRREPIFALTIPTKLQAYLACGKPVIAGLDGEAPRIIAEAGAGMTAPASDPDALAAAVLKLMRLLPAEREAMGGRALAYSRENFAQDRLLDRLVGYLRDAVARWSA